MPDRPQRPATHLLYRAETGAWPASGDARCWLCGWACPTDGAAAADVVRSTFNDMARARRGGDGDRSCAACTWYFDHKILREGGARAMGFFTKTVIVLGARWYEWEREAMADDLLRWQRDGLPEVAVLAINFSKQKHVFPWARVSPAGSRAPWIETDIGRCRPPQNLATVLRAIAILWIAGHPKTLLARGEGSPYVLARAEDPAQHLALLATLRPLVGTVAMDVATYLVTETNRDRLAAHA